jgi:hypothetical protein
MVHGDVVMKPCGNGRVNSISEEETASILQSRLSRGRAVVPLKEAATFLLNDGNTDYFHKLPPPKRIDIIAESLRKHGSLKSEKSPRLYCMKLQHTHNRKGAMISTRSTKQSVRKHFVATTTVSRRA